MKGSKLLHNIAALSSLQVATLVLPLLTVPFLTRVLGVDVWGRVAFVQIVLSYFCHVTAWGFGWSATRKVSALRDDPIELSRILAVTWYAQWLLAAVVLMLLGLLVLFVPFFHVDAALYLAGIGMIFGSVLFPVWFLNGLERMKESASVQILSRILVVILTFALIRSAADAAKLMWIYALGSVIPGLFSLWWIHRRFRLDWRSCSLGSAWREIRDGREMFLSTVAISLYTTAIPVVLGLWGGASSVAYYSLADRARQAASAVLAPISQALFPRMSHLFAHDASAAVRLLKKSGMVLVLLSAALSIGLWLGAPLIIQILGGDAFLPAVSVLRWLSVLPLVIALSNIFGVQIMLPNHQNRAFNVILGGAGILSLALMLPLIHHGGAIGAAINTVITELGVTMVMGIYLMREGYFSGRLLRREPHEG